MKQQFKENTLGWYTMSAIPPHCSEKRIRVKFVRKTSIGRILLEETDNPRFSIDTTASSFTPDAEPEAVD